eukprot:TRINITY_DN3882_c0_g1_i2.p2 TRINITY_DN3882_c0_g1~~TRINITY_DN3882_c0_g1_i2.p2  ORF type:complete len:145 (-),score=4.59 TRINITY_DN3882_c0_g1_i2:486-920(-)
MWAGVPSEPLCLHTQSLATAHFFFYNNNKSLITIPINHQIQQCRKGSKCKKYQISNNPIKITIPFQTCPNPTNIQIKITQPKYGVIKKKTLLGMLLVIGGSPNFVKIFGDANNIQFNIQIFRFLTNSFHAFFVLMVVPVKTLVV